MQGFCELNGVPTPVPVCSGREIIGTARRVACSGKNQNGTDRNTPYMGSEQTGTDIYFLLEWIIKRPFWAIKKRGDL